MENKEELKDLEKSLERYKGLNALKDLEGGKALLKYAQQIINSEVQWLVSNYKEGNETEIRARIARIEAFQTNMSVITNAKENAEVIEEEIKSLKE